MHNYIIFTRNDISSYGKRFICALEYIFYVKYLFLSAPAGKAAVSAVRQFYEKLILLPLDDKAPALFSHYLITASTLERVGKPWHIRAVKNGFILQDVIETVQLKPDRLDIFCLLLQDVAADLAQRIRGICSFIQLRIQFTDMMWCTVFRSVAVMCLETGTIDMHSKY